MYKFTTALNTIGKELLSELPDRLCTHPASYSMDITGNFPKAEAEGLEHSMFLSLRLRIG